MNPATLVSTLSTISGLRVDLDVLLGPVPGPHPAGTSLRYEPVFHAIRAARAHDDATLPMGEWERPLVKADWKQAAALCTDALATRSKDFQLAAWLCEAWTHLHGAAGFAAGTRVLSALVLDYWDSAYPELGADGDNDARCAPFAWLNETLPMILVLHVPLLRLDDVEPGTVNLDLWEQTANGAEGEDGMSREFLVRRAGEGANRAALAGAQRHLGEALPLWEAFGRLLDDRLGADAPSLARVSSALARLARAANALAGDAAPVPADAQAGDGAPVRAPQSLHEPQYDRWPEPQYEPQRAAPACAPEVPMPYQAAAPAAGIASRAQAYRLLEDVADYLSQHEPHSPTPYLLRRAIGWGSMPLAELMQDILREEGDVGRYLALLERR